jgi:feruloyl esterase
MATDNPDLSAFKARGGKLISYHGWADPVIMPQGTVKYFDSLKAKFGSQAEVSSFAKLFMVPEMGHCFGGAGPNSFGQFMSKPRADADHDVFKALVKWVEKGTPPEKIIATKYTDDDTTKPVLRTRPLCEYPRVAKYNGTGSTDDAANFSCAAP